MKTIPVVQFKGKMIYNIFTRRGITPEAKFESFYLEFLKNKNKKQLLPLGGS